jgi:coenzyme Q-binding protein COQ10
MPAAQKTIVINASPEKVFSVIVDYANYPQFLNEVNTASVDSKQGNITVASFSVDIKVKKIKYTISLTEESNSSVSWTLIRGDFMEQNNGSWHLKDLGNGSTEATYKVEIIPKVPRHLSFMKSKISSALAERSLPATLASFKSRAEKL